MICEELCGHRAKAELPWLRRTTPTPELRGANYTHACQPETEETVGGHAQTVFNVASKAKETEICSTPPTDGSRTQKCQTLKTGPNATCSVSFMGTGTRYLIKDATCLITPLWCKNTCCYMLTHSHQVFWGVFNSEQYLWHSSVGPTDKTSVGADAQNVLQSAGLPVRMILH